VRVGVDTSPLVQTRAGTARVVRGLLGALRDRPGLDLDLLSFGGDGRVSSVLRDALWYPVGLKRRARALDVLHCTTFRGPVGASVPTVVTVHDLAILRAPEAFPRWHRLYGNAGLDRVLRAADAVVAVSPVARLRAPALAPPKDRDFGIVLGPWFTTFDEAPKAPSTRVTAGGETTEATANAFDWEAARLYAEANTRLRVGDLLLAPAAVTADVPPGEAVVDVAGLGRLELAVGTA